LDKTKFNVKRIVMEATGGYEKLVVRELAKINLPVIVVNARHIKSFARALGRLAKTDKLDCQMIAEFGKKIEPELRTIRSEELEFLSEVVSRRNQLSETIIAEKSRLDKGSSREVLKSIKKHIRWLEMERACETITNGSRYRSNTCIDIDI
jgi:transposase